MRYEKSSHKGSKCLLLLTLFFLISTVILSHPPTTSISTRRSGIGFASGFASSSSSVTIIGANQVIGGGAESFSFVQSIASQGLKWDRESVGTSTAKLANLVWDEDAGINVLALMGGGDPETSCGSGLLQSESQYKSYVQTLLNDWPWIHHWEYGNEVQSYWCNISPQNYFQGLVWAYEVMSTTSGHTMDTIQGPTETIWTEQGSSSCYDSSKLTWFEQFWGLSDPSTGLTPAKILSYVSLHVYTKGQLWSATLTSGPCAGETVGTMLGNALNAYYNAEGRTKEIIISETGYASGNTATSYNNQATWYQQVIPFYNSLGFVKGVFAYDLFDSQAVLWGLFTSSLQPKPAWSVYQSYLSGTLASPSSATTTTTSIAITINSTVSRSTTTASLTSSNSSSSSPASVVFSQLDPIVQILSGVSPEKNPPVAFGVTICEFCLIGGLAFVVIRSRKSGMHSLGIRRDGKWWRISKNLVSWTGRAHLMHESGKILEHYRRMLESCSKTIRSITRIERVFGRFNYHHRSRLNMHYRQIKRGNGRRNKTIVAKAGASKNSHNAPNHVIRKKSSRSKPRRSAIKKAPKDSVLEKS